MAGASSRVGIGLALLVLLGCGRGEIKLTPVQGKVFYRGQPLPGGTIVFAPDPERGNSGPLASCEIQPDGQYILRTGSQPGAVPGWHRVTVAAPARWPAPNAAWSLPREFSHPDQSGQVHEIKSGGLNTIDVKLE